MQTTVSIVIPAYNAAAFIEEALDSVVSQIRQPDEVVIVDDGSTDNTYEVVVNWLSSHPDFPGKIVCQENQGASAARNTAIENATKDYIAFLDADDLLLPEHLGLLLNGAKLCPECVIVFADQEVFSGEKIITHSFLSDKPVLKLPFESLGEFRVISCSVWPTLIRGSYIPNGANLIKRIEATNVGGFDTLLATSEDRHFLLKLSRLGRVGYFNKVIGRQRKHDANLTHSNNDLKVAKNAVIVIEKLLSDTAVYHLTQEELRETQNALDTAIANYVYVASKHDLANYFNAWFWLLKSRHYKYLLHIKPFLRAIFNSIETSIHQA